MVLQRDVDSIPEGYFSETAVSIVVATFVRIASAEDEFGILRFSTLEADWTGALDPRPEWEEDSSHTWRGGSTGVLVDRVSQTNSSALDVSAISFPNVDDEGTAGPWTQREIQYGLSGREVTVWEAWWTPGEDPARDAMTGRFIIYNGRSGAVEHNLRTTITLQPFRASWSMKTGRPMLSTVCSFALKGLYGNTGEAAETCQLSAPSLAAFPTCGGSLPECIERENEIHFGGFPIMLKPNTTIYIGGQRFTI